MVCAPCCAVVDKSPAARAGVKVGDVILKFGDTPIKDARDLSKAVARAEPGSKVHIEIVRNGKPMTLRPKQFVIAMGMSAVTNMPSYPGMYGGSSGYSPYNNPAMSYLTSGSPGINPFYAGA